MVNLVNSWKIDKAMFGPNSEDLSFTQGPNFHSGFLLTLWQQGHSQQNGWYLKMLPTGDEKMVWEMMGPARTINFSR